MTLWELILEAMADADLKEAGWLSIQQIVERVLQKAPGTNHGTIDLQVRAHCVNEPNKDNFPDKAYLRDPLFVTEDPAKRGKRFRLLTADERAAFLRHPRTDLQKLSYAQLLDTFKVGDSAAIEERIAKSVEAAGGEPDTETETETESATRGETAYAKSLVAHLRTYVEPVYTIAERKSLLYALWVDETGNLVPRLDRRGDPIRGGGTGFEQDILVFERVPGGVTEVVPRVIAEVKLGSVSTHDTLTYAEKARRVRVIYPYVRYGLILGGLVTVPGRVLRLGQEFDFIVALPSTPSSSEVDSLGNLFKSEAETSKYIGDALSGRRKVRELRRELRITFA